MRGLVAPPTGVLGWAGPFARSQARRLGSARGACWRALHGWSAATDRVWVRKLVTSGGNVAGAAFAAYLLLPNLRFFVQTHHPIGLVFAIQQAWVGLAFLTRRTPRTVSRRPLDWVVAYAAWFTYFLVRPSGHDIAWVSSLGLSIQVAGLALWAWAFAKLARSYGVVAADRGAGHRRPVRAGAPPAVCVPTWWAEPATSSKARPPGTSSSTSWPSASKSFASRSRNVISTHPTTRRTAPVFTGACSRASGEPPVNRLRARAQDTNPLTSSAGPTGR